MHAIQAAWYSAFAAIDFRINKDKENQERLLKRLTCFFKIMSKYSADAFDYNKAAELELRWWLVDRYPGRYTTSREDALAEAMGVVYRVKPRSLEKYAQYRRAAMVLYDKAEDEHKQVDWKEIGSLLKMSFQSLHVAVHI